LKNELHIEKNEYYHVEFIVLKLIFVHVVLANAKSYYLHNIY